MSDETMSIYSSTEPENTYCLENKAQIPLTDILLDLHYISSTSTEKAPKNDSARYRHGSHIQTQFQLQDYLPRIENKRREPFFDLINKQV